MSKAMLVTLPFVLLLLDYWPLGRFLLPSRSPVGKAARQAPATSPSLGWLLLEKVPFLILAAIFSFITYSVQQTAGAVIGIKSFPLDARLANAVVSYAHYVGRTFWPTSLAMLYPYENWTSARIAGSTGLFAGLSWLAIWSARRRPYVFVGWFWFIGMLIPVIGLVQVGLQVMADRYTYLPLIGIFIILAWGLAELAALSSRRALVVSGAVLALVFLMPATAKQVRYWKDSQTLFEHTLAVTGHSTVANYILGALADSQGRTDDAMAHFNAAIQDDPGNVKARCGLAFLLCDQGRLDDAAAQYYAALRIAPDSAKAHFGLAEVLLRQHLPDEAMDHYNLALQANPNIAEAHYQLAALCGAHHDTGSAINHLQAAIRLAPDWPLPFNNLAWILATQSDPQFRNGPEATKLALRAVTLTGETPSMLDTLAAAYAESGQFADAVATAQSAVQKAGNSGETNLASEIESHLKSFQSEHALRE
jgi:tetratricopeptide (TPR) repeat protein